MQVNFSGTAQAVRLKTVTSVACEEESTSSVMMTPVSYSATKGCRGSVGGPTAVAAVIFADGEVCHDSG